MRLNNFKRKTCFRDHLKDFLDKLKEINYKNEIRSFSKHETMQEIENQFLKLKENYNK